MPSSISFPTKIMMKFSSMPDCNTAGDMGTWGAAIGAHRLVVKGPPTRFRYMEVEQLHAPT
jgi:hypothetical protein